MTHESIQPILDWISTHPTWSGIVVFLISLSESLAIVGLLVPGVVMMTAIGAMMGAGILPFWETLFWAVLGAIAGDGISYWLGYHYHDRIRGFWPFKQFPKLLVRGETFFKNHGGKSIIFGRFVGPVRPMIPVIAGMMDMSPKRFLVFNILSAIAWAPLYSLPGILIGMSLGSLTPEEASRAGLFVILLLLALWVVYEILLFIGASILSFIFKCLDMVWRILNRLSWLREVLKTSQGTEQGQLGLMLLFLLAASSFYWVQYDVLNSTGIAEWNEPVYQVLRALYSDKWISTLGLLTGLGAPFVLLPTATAIGIWLIWLKRFKAASSLLLVVGLGFITGSLIKFDTAIQRPEGLLYSIQQYAFPSNHALTTTLFFGMAAFLIQYSVSRKYRWLPFFIVIPTILVISFSRIYLGMHWFTDILGSLTLGTAFVTFGAFIYRKVEVKHVPIRAILLPGILTVSIMFSVYAANIYPEERQELIRQWSTHNLILKEWWQGKGDTQGLYRTGAFKHQATVFDIQWLGSLTSVEKQLEEMGWRAIPKLSLKTAVMLLANDPLPTQFPVMPKFHRDRLPVLVVAKPVNDYNRLVIQIWKSDFISKEGTPLWVGTLRLEEVSHPLPLMSIYLESRLKSSILRDFQMGLKADHQMRTHIVISKHAIQHRILLIRSP